MRFLLVAALSLFCSESFKAQNTTRFGVITGFNSAYIENVRSGFDDVYLAGEEVDLNGVTRYDATLGFNSGFALMIDLTEKISFHSEMFYSMKGFRSTETALNHKYQNVCFPLCLSYGLDDSFSFLAGIEGAYLFRAISKSTDGSKIDLLGDDFLNYRSYDVGGVMGAIFQDPDNGLAFSVRYIHGFVSTMPNEITISNEVGTTVGTAKSGFYNRCFNFSVHYYL